MALRNPDDFQSRPVRFTSFDQDGSVITIYGVNSPWHMPKLRPIGEIVIRQSVGGIVSLCITLEEGWQEGK